MRTPGVRKNWVFAGAHGVCRRTFAAAGIIVAVLSSGEAQAFRTLSDLPEFSGAASGIRWEDARVPIHVNLEAPSGTSLEEWENGILAGLNVWSLVDCSGVVFDYRGITSEPAQYGDLRNTVQWVGAGWATYGFDPNAAAVTDLRVEEVGDSWRIVEADVYINGEHFTWTTAETAAGVDRSIVSVMAHEGGHLLGLAHPCEIDPTDGAPDCSEEFPADATMYPYYDPAQNSLSDDDITGVCSLYAGADCGNSGCESGLFCTPSGCQPLCGGRVCTENESCVDEVCVFATDACDGDTCQQSSSCARDVDCGEDSSCVEGFCTPGSGEDGDPCSSARECAGGACTADGYCSTTCATANECGTDETCDARQSACVSNKQPYGAVCSESDECIGDECLDGFTDEPVCTRRCGEGHASCPAGWLCDLVEGRAVCTPLEAGGGGVQCSVSRPTSRTDGGLAALGCLLGLAAAARFRARSRRRLVRTTGRCSSQSMANRSAAAGTRVGGTSCGGTQ